MDWTEELDLSPYDLDQWTAPSRLSFLSYDLDDHVAGTLCALNEQWLAGYNDEHIADEVALAALIRERVPTHTLAAVDTIVAPLAAAGGFFGKMHQSPKDAYTGTVDDGIAYIAYLRCTDAVDWFVRCVKSSRVAEDLFQGARQCFFVAWRDDIATAPIERVFIVRHRRMNDTHDACAALARQYEQCAVDVAVLADGPPVVIEVNPLDDETDLYGHSVEEIEAFYAASR